MNCQDITRIVDTGSFSRLKEAERNAAAAHASTCRHCAPVWAAHARLADLRIPSMPAELAVRVRTLAALPAQASGRPAVRRLTVVGSLVALAAAATMFAVNQADEEVPASPPAVVATSSATDSAAVMPMPEVAVPAVNAVAVTPAPPPQKARAQPQAPLPLLPAPVYGNNTDRAALMELALMKAAERHPELVEGPQIDELYSVGVALREDGTVVSTTAKLATRENYREIDAEVSRTLPTDGGGGSSLSSRPKGTLLPNGRALRANVSLRTVTIPMGYDMSRSTVRVQQTLQTVRDRYADQMRPASGGEMNRLAVFLSEDGTVQRANVEPIMDLQNRRTIRGGDPDDAMFLAKAIARQLELDVAQIGLMGVTALEEGSRVLVTGADGSVQPDDRRRVLVVYYAWPRRATESGPSFGQVSSTAARQGVDPAVALQIVERLIPDAFTLKDPAAGQPTIVLTAKGEIIRAGRVKFVNGGGMDTTLQQQLVPGVRTSSFADVKVRNNLGETVAVQFAWEIPPDMAKAMKEAGR